MARKIEMHWVCSSCGARNLGRHKRCQSCGDPKDASEPWLMPSDTRAAPTVTDPKLLRQASAGPDWQCGFCGSHQRRLDGRCGHCGAAQSEGARVPQGGARPRHQPVFAQGASTRQPQRSTPVRGGGARAGFTRAARYRAWLLLPAALLLLALLSLSCVGLLILGADPPPPVKPTYEGLELLSVSWRRVVHIERYQTLDAEGFVEDRPEDAFDIRSLGQAHHHDEQVLDHYETETYWEDVPYQDTETYTEQEQCGEDCYGSPETCHEVCTPDDNGFASCRDVCSGGGQSCSPRYCSVTRTRSVTRYRQEQRTRQVARYRTEPRYAERFAWRVWRWRHDRDVTSDGDASSPPAWPSEAELAPRAPLGEGERERDTREESLSASLRGIRTGAFETLELSPFTYREIQRHRRWYIERTDAGLRLYKPAPDPI